MKYDPDTQSPLFSYSEAASNNQGKLLFIIATDTNGELEIFWYVNPEEIIESAVLYPEAKLGIDKNGTIWTGKYVLHFIKSATLSKRFYHFIKN